MAVQDARVGPPPAPGTPRGALFPDRARARSQAALTKFKVAADAYPSTDAGIYARYQEGGDVAGARHDARRDRRLRAGDQGVG